MEYIYIGKIVNTHAIKGEVRIISNFEYKEKVFNVGNILYVGESYIPLEIETYRKHKKFDMVKFKDINNISEVLKYKGLFVYFKKEDLNLNNGEYLDSDFIGLEAYYNGVFIGIIKIIEYNGGKKLFVINNKYIPYHSNFIENIDLKNKKIILKNVEGLL